MKKKLKRNSKNFENLNMKPTRKKNSSTQSANHLVSKSKTNKKFKTVMRIPLILNSSKELERKKLN
jgi:hypothetical protein